MRYLTAALLLLAAQASAQTTDPQRATAACVVEIKQRLKDPESARIKPDLSAVVKGQWFVSIDVNAKNSFGAYQGERRWWCDVELGTFKVKRVVSDPNG